MARLLTSGFEDNNLTGGGRLWANQNANTTTQTTTVRSGTYALRCQTTAGTGRVDIGVGGAMAIVSADQTIPGYFRTYFRVATLPASTTTRIMQVSTTAGTIRVSINITSAGTLQLKQNNGTQIGSTSSALSLNTWYRLEMVLDGAASSGTASAYIDGVQFATGTAGNSLTWGSLSLGSSATETVDFYFDDVAINDNTGSYQNSFPGDGKVVRLFPNAAGDNNAWTTQAGAAGTTNNYTLVDEVTCNQNTDYVRCSVLNDVDFYGVTDSSTAGIGASDTINAVQTISISADSVADATLSYTTQIKKTTGGTIATGSNAIPNSTSFLPFLLQTLHNDPDGSAWTSSTIDTMQIGLKLTATSGSRRIHCSTLWAYVDYTPVSVTPVSSSDTGSGSDTHTALTTALTGSDTGAVVDAGTLAATTSSSDTGNTAEGATVGVGGADTASGSDTHTALVVSLSSADTATAADAGTLATALTGSDTSSAADTHTALTATLTGSDTGSGTEGTTPTIGLSGTDTGSTAEAASLATTLTGSDTGAATDAGTLTTSLTGSDTGSATDAGTLASALQGADTGAAAEAVGAQVAALTGADTGSVAEGQSLNTGSNISDGDTGALTDQATALTATLADGDTGTGTEGAPTLTAALGGTETLSAADAENAPAVTLTSADLGSIAEVAAVTVPTASADTAATVEAESLTVLLTEADVIAALDAAGDRTASSADTATAVDAVVVLTAPRRYVLRPSTGLVTRPDDGYVVRPDTGLVTRP